MLPGVLCCSTLAALRWNELRCLPAVPAAAPHCPPRPPQPHPRTSDPLRARSELNHQFVEAGAAESEVAQQMAVLEGRPLTPAHFPNDPGLWEEVLDLTPYINLSGAVWGGVWCGVWGVVLCSGRWV